MKISEFSSLKQVLDNEGAVIVKSERATSGAFGVLTGSTIGLMLMATTTLTTTMVAFSE